LSQAGVARDCLPVLNRGLIFPQMRLSDHASFWSGGDQVIMVTDRAFLRNPHDHKPRDTIATLNLDFLASVCQGWEIGIRQLS
jgi:hypothetical protein